MDYCDKFLKRKAVTMILGENYHVTDTERYSINDFFEKNVYRKEEDRFMRYARWLQRGILNWEEMNFELSKHKRMSLGYFKILYGNEDGEIQWDNTKSKITAHFKNKVEYWENLGFSKDESVSLVSSVQKDRSKKRQEMDNRELSPRCIEYWMSKGYTEKQSRDIISKNQRRDITFFINRYGKSNGSEKYRESIRKRKKTWKNKSKSELIEHSIKIRKNRTYSRGLEIEVIEKFINVNNLHEYRLVYGREQHYEITDRGARFYDLAVFDGDRLYIVFEFHGIGHINFSDYNSDMYDKVITDASGKELPHLGTYGNVYWNDMHKKEFIEDHYPGVLYCVCWLENYKENRMTIEDVKTKRK